MPDKLTVTQELATWFEPQLKKYYELITVRWRYYKEKIVKLSANIW